MGMEIRKDNGRCLRVLCILCIIYIVYANNMQSRVAVGFLRCEWRWGMEGLEIGIFGWYFLGWCVGEMAIEIMHKTGSFGVFNTPYIDKLKYHKIIVL